MVRDPHRTGNLRRSALAMDAQGVKRVDIADRLQVRRSYLYRIMRGVWPLKQAKHSASKESLLLRKRASAEFGSKAGNSASTGVGGPNRTKTPANGAGGQVQFCPVLDCVKADTPALLTLHCIQEHRIEKVLRAAELELAGAPLTSCIVTSCKAIITGGAFTEHYIEAHK